MGKGAPILTSFMVTGQCQKWQLKTPQALGTVSFCVDLTFKSWVAAVFRKGSGEAGTMTGECEAFQRRTSAQILSEGS